jgi:hypothetical protein
MSEIELKPLHRKASSLPAGKARAGTCAACIAPRDARRQVRASRRLAKSRLKGEPGKIRMLQNAGGRVIDRLPSDDLAGKPGADVVLSIDAELQNYAISRFGAEAGSAVMIDVATGEVVCMMSTPRPIRTLFVSGIGSTLFKSLRDDERNPLYHKAYDGVYPPGSTFKLVVAAAALESGAMKPEDTVHVLGQGLVLQPFLQLLASRGPRHGQPAHAACRYRATATSIARLNDRHRGDRQGRQALRPWPPL